MIWGYVICEPATATPVPRCPGLGGAMVRALESDGLAAVYSRHRSLRPRPSTQLVLAHERVVEAVMERGAVLPLRFGTQLESEEALTAALDDRRGELLRALERVRGRVELALRVIPERAFASSGGQGAASGRAYLLGRVDEHRRGQQAARELHAPLAELATDSAVRERPAPPAILAATYLVDAGLLAAFRARAGELAARQHGMHVVVTGPLPPYSFAMEEQP